MKIRKKREKISEKKSGFFGSVRHSLGSSPRTSVRQDVGRLRLSPSISSGGTREPR